jgi:hypothetical protein
MVYKFKTMRNLFYLIVIIGSFINSTAQTGIGTTTPVNKLQVETTVADPATTGTTANGNLRLSGTTGSHVLDFGLSGAATYSWLQSRSKLAYGTSYNLVLNPNGGSVGIGTTAPPSTLTLGNAAGTIGGELLLNPTSTQYEGGQIIFKRSLVGSTVDWTIDQYGTTSSNARFRIFNGSSENNGLSILESGKIGMGTPSPSTLLHLQNSNTFSGADTPGLNTVPSILVYNSNNASTAAHSIMALRTNGSNGGNPYLSFDIEGIIGYSLGIDNADADKLKLHNNWNLNNSNTPAITITTDGKIGLGTNSPSRKLHLQTADATSAYIESTSSDNNGMVILNANSDQNWSTNYHEFMIFQKQGNSLGFIGTTTNGSTMLYTSNSDYRLKNDLKTFNGLDLINQIKIYDFAWKANGSRMHGVMAHELQDVIPYAVSGVKDEINPDGSMKIQAVDYSKLTPILTKAIQEQDFKIKEQQKQIEALMKRIEQLETKK